MSTAVQQLLHSFDALAEVDKRQATIEILRRFAGTGPGGIAEETLIEAADELFRALDGEEARHAAR